MEKKYFKKSKTTDWSSEHILDDLGLKKEDLKGKLILDIGSGGANLALNSIDANIISIDPKYGSGSDNEIITKAEKKLKEIDLPRLAALAEELSFKGSIFDLVLSHYGSPMYQTDLNSLEIAQDLVKKSIKEMAYVLKEGGQIRLHSVLDRDYAPERQWIEDALAEIKDYRFDIKYSRELIVITKNKN